MFSSSIHKCKISSSRAQVVADVTTCVSNVYAAHQVRVRRSMALTVLAHRLLAFYHAAVCVLCVRVRVRACVYMCVYVCVCVCVTALARIYMYTSSSSYKHAVRHFGNIMRVHVSKTHVLLCPVPSLLDATHCNTPQHTATQRECT